MRYNEILTEMAFDRPGIIRALESYNTRIFEHAVKIIVLPNSQDVPHWKRELRAWTGYLSSLRIKTKGTPPMGYKLAYQYLYEGPFVGNELGMTAHFIELVEASHDIDLNADVAAVHARLKEFLTKLADDIGSGRNVVPTLDTLTVT